LDERTTTFSWEDDAAVKTEKAPALAQRMIDWFRDNYEDPAESTRFCSEEGGYMYLCGFVANIGKTACGRKLEACPGDMDWGSEDEVTCKACLNVLKRKEERRA
jgi:hypothetical protein